RPPGATGLPRRRAGRAVGTDLGALRRLGLRARRRGLPLRRMERRPRTSSLGLLGDHGKRAANASATAGGTVLEMSPLNRAISRISRDDTNEWVVADGRNTVWTPEMARFIWACWSSDSKSD